MTAVVTLAADQYPAGTRHTPHQHDTVQLSIVLAGRVAETVGRVTEQASALSVVCKAAGVMHADQFGPAGARLARLTLPHGVLAPLLDDPQRATEWRWTHDPTVAMPFLRLIGRAAQQPCTVAPDDADFLDLLAAFTARPARQARGHPPAWLDRTIRDLAVSWTSQHGVGDVARHAGVHPVYLARCVRRWYGISVGNMLRELRLRTAVAHSIDGDHSVSHAAHAAGYADESHFNRAMHAATGLTPGRYRALVRTLEFTVRRHGPTGGLPR